MAAVRAILISVLLLAPALAWAQSTPIYTYDSNYNQEPGVITAPGSVTSMTYDTTGSQTGLIVDSGSAGIETRYQYDTNGNLTQTTPEPSTVTSSTYDTLDNDLITGDGNHTVYRYDTNGNITETIPTTDRITSTVYDTQGNLIVVGTEDALGRTTETYYDETGNVLGAFSPLGDVTATAYDGTGRDLIVASDIAGVNTMTVYDGVGNVIQTIDTPDPVTNVVYDSQANTVAADFPARSFFDVFTDISIPGANEFQNNVPLVVPTPGNAGPLAYDSVHNQLFVAVTPESNSLALIVPGLLLLGFMFLRRRAKSHS
jgi:YD repeat-containing protein